MMGRYRTGKDAMIGFKLECAKPGAVSMEVRGQMCLSKFRGVEVKNCTKKSMTSEISQAMAVDSMEDL